MTMCAVALTGLTRWLFFAVLYISITCAPMAGWVLGVSF